MKAQNKILFIFSLFLIFSIVSEVNTSSDLFQTIVSEDAEFPNAYTLKDGKVIVMTSAVGNLLKTNICKYNEEGRILYGPYTISPTYSEDAHFVQPANSDYYLIQSHDKLTSTNTQSKEHIITLKDQSPPMKSVIRKNGIYQKSSVVALKNGNVIIAGIGPKTTFGAESETDINIYDPTTLTSGNGLSFKGHSDYISCFEQKANEVYCAYVSYEDVFVSKLKIKHIVVNDKTLVDKGDQVIKAFYTEFNFLKAIPFNEEESLILFQTGNGSSKLGHHGGNLFFYHLKVTSSPFIVAIFTDQAVQDTFIGNVETVLGRGGYYGVNLDFEYVYQFDRQSYNQFLRRFTDRMHALGYIVVSALAPKISDDQQGLLYTAHDYEFHLITCILSFIYSFHTMRTFIAFIAFSLTAFLLIIINNRREPA